MSAENRSSVSRGFRRLLHSIRGKGSSSKKTAEDNDTENGDSHSLPFLPAQRPRPLTPTAPQQSSATLGTLARLPPELRRRILIAAFGGRTLHLDLQFAHPRSAAASDPSAPGFGCSGEAVHGLGASPLSPYYFPDRDAPRAWRWTSCVCHRMMPPGSRFERRSLARGYPVYRYPHTDDCLRGEALYCSLWPPEAVSTPGKCMVGAIGWLLACRQAYVEGIDVLYSTNTFFIESDVLFKNLVCREPGPDARHLILPERLACITSVELLWDLILFGVPPRPARGGREHNIAQDRAQLTANLRYLCNAFPNLANLVLSFRDRLYNNRDVRPAHALDEIDRLLLRPLADAVARLPLPAGQKPVVVELPSNVFGELNGLKRKDAPPGLGLEEEQKGWEVGDGKGVWLRYPLPARLAETDKSSKAAPNPDDGTRAFYYIKEGPESPLFWDHNGTPRARGYHIQSCPG